MPASRLGLDTSYPRNQVYPTGPHFLPEITKIERMGESAPAISALMSVGGTIGQVAKSFHVQEGKQPEKQMILVSLAKRELYCER